MRSIRRNGAKCRACWRWCEDFSDLEIAVDYMKIRTAEEVPTFSDKAPAVRTLLHVPEPPEEQDQIALSHACVRQDALRRARLPKSGFPTFRRIGTEAGPQVRVNVAVRERFSRPELPQQICVIDALPGQIFVCIPVICRNRQGQQRPVRQDRTRTASVGGIKAFSG